MAEAVVIDVKALGFCKSRMRDMQKRISELEMKVTDNAISRYMLAYTLVEMDLEKNLNKPMNELIEGRYLSKKVHTVLRQYDFDYANIADMIRTIKLQWDAAHYEEK